ncbi:MAG TPA: GyrI-like domain-containing protein [Bryobacteraceae bacterium]|nr:GyrI-like domain-containing protein [Bryobacteraceae bacterium]
MKDKDQMNENKIEGAVQPTLFRRDFLSVAAGAVGAVSLAAPLLRATPQETGNSQSGSRGALTRARLDITHYISIRHVGPYTDVNATWARLSQFAMSQGLAGSSVITLAAACPCGDINAPIESDGGTGATTDAVGGQSAAGLQYDACLAVSAADHGRISQYLSAAKENVANVRTGTVNLGDTLMVVHQGPYATIGDTYRKAVGAGATLFSSAKADGLPFAIEVYRNNPLLTKQSDLITEIHFPLGSQYSATGPLFH